MASLNLLCNSDKEDIVKKDLQTIGASIKIDLTDYKATLLSRCFLYLYSLEYQASHKELTAFTYFAIEAITKEDSLVATLSVIQSIFIEEFKAVEKS